MAANAKATRPYDRLIQGTRHRRSRVPNRNLEEEADADRGRVLFSAPFRRLQNKAQVFSLESNAAIRSRLTHSLEVSSIGRFVAQQSLKAFSETEAKKLGLDDDKERPILTFVETACLLHDLGNPPFGHFGEIAISDWFHVKESELKPGGIAGATEQNWDKFYGDFKHFDGNPQGLRIATKLQAPETNDLFGLNLTATTLAATIKYPWTTTSIGCEHPAMNEGRKKAGYFHAEQSVVDWICSTLGLNKESRHPLVYLMEAADDIAYCMSDVEDGIEKGLIDAQDFARAMKKHTKGLAMFKKSAKGEDARDASFIASALKSLEKPGQKTSGPESRRLFAMNDFRGALIRILARHAGIEFRKRQENILEGKAKALLDDSAAPPLLSALSEFASSHLYSSPIVRNRELTAHAVLCGMLDAYLPLMSCELARFTKARNGKRRDDDGRNIAREGSLMSRIPEKHLAVYSEETRLLTLASGGDKGTLKTMERLHRIRLVVDYISGMTDQFAFQTFQLISGTAINPHGT
jgi:dGTPase